MLISIMYCMCALQMGAFSVRSPAQGTSLLELTPGSLKRLELDSIDFSVLAHLPDFAVDALHPPPDGVLAFVLRPSEEVQGFLNQDADIQVGS
jgi:hypothetical protein